MTMQDEAKKEVFSQPVSTAVHLVTLAVMVAGFGGVIATLQTKMENADRRMVLMEEAVLRLTDVSQRHEREIGAADANVKALERQCTQGNQR